MFSKLFNFDDIIVDFHISWRNKPMKNTRYIYLVALFLLGIQEAKSAPFKLPFNGTVTSVFTDPSDPFNGSIDVGTHIAGFANYETTTPDAIVASDVGSYSMFASPPLGMAMFIGGYTFAASDFLNISVANNISIGIDQLTILAQQGNPGGLENYLFLQLFLEDPSGTAFSSDALPLSQPNMSNFLVQSFFIDGIKTINGEVVQFQIQGINSVPEANSIYLLIIGLFCLGYMRHLQMRTSIKS
jgi:hypothetical protein